MPVVYDNMCSALGSDRERKIERERDEGDFHSMIMQKNYFSANYCNLEGTKKSWVLQVTSIWCLEVLKAILKVFLNCTRM